MAVDVVAKPQAYDTDGETAAFVLPWTHDDPDHVLVVVEPATGAPAELARGIDYVVSGDAESGFVVDLAGRYGAPDAGGRLIVARRQPALQQIPFNDQVKFPAARVASMGDRAARAVQDLAWDHSLSIRFPVTDYPTTKTVLPHAAARAQKRLGFDAEGMPHLFDADINLRIRHNGDLILDGVNDIDFRGGVAVLAGDDKRAIVDILGGAGGTPGPGGEVVGELEAWLTQRLRRLQTEVGDLHNTITQMQFGDWFSRAGIRRFVVEREASITAAYLEAIIAETGPGSALAGRVETVEAIVEDPDTGNIALGNSLDLIEARVTVNEGDVSILSTALTATQADLDLAELDIAANASTVSLHTSQISAIDGDVTVLAQQVDTVEATANDASATASTALTATADIDGALNATWQVTLGAGGKISGIKAFNDGQTSAFDILADRFSVSNPSGGGAVTPFRVEGGAVFINEARIKDLIADNFAANAGVTVGATSANTIRTTTSASFVDMPDMSGLTRQFDEDSVALIMFWATFLSSNAGGDKRIFTRLEDVHSGQGTRILSSRMTSSHFKSSSSNDEEHEAFGLVAARMDAGMHTLSMQWQKLGGGDATVLLRKLIIVGFKGASFSGLAGDPGDAGGGSGVGGSNWTGGVLP